MADLLHGNLSNSFNFSPHSLPLNLPHHPNFSFIRFTPLKRRFSHFTLLASHSSQFHITSRTEHADGSVIFKFGDASEVSEVVDDFDGGNEVELERDDKDGDLVEQSNVVKDDESGSVDNDEEFLKSGLKLKENCDDSVEDEPKIDSTSTSEVENSGDLVEVEPKTDSTLTIEVENSGVLVEDEPKSESISKIEVENFGVLVEDKPKNGSTLTIEVSSNLVKDELKSDSNFTVQVKDLSVSVEDELNNDSNLSVGVSSDSNSTAEVDDDEVKKIDLTSTAKVEDPAEFVTVKSDINGVNNVVASTCDSSIEVMIEKGDELSEGSEEMNSDEKLECGGGGGGGDGESTIFSDTSSPGEAMTSEDEIAENVVEEDNGAVISMSEQLEAEPVFDEDQANKVKSVSEQLKAEPILVKEDENAVELVSEALEAEPILEEDDEDSVELISKQLEAEPILDEEVSSDSLDDVVALGSNKVALAGHPSIANLDDEPFTRDISDATPGVEASGITSTDMNSDSLNLVDNLSVTASSKLSSEVNGASPPTISQSDDGQHCYDISLEAGSGLEPSTLPSAEATLVSVETSTVVSSTTPETASLPESSEVHDISTHSVSQSDDNQSDVLVTTGPVTPGVTSLEASLDSLNKVEIAASPFSVSSAVATLAHSLEDLAGGKDSYFVSDNWFGVADGVGQWSFGGVDIGLYAHELMQNCENLLKSTDAELTSVKELLQQSAAMTQSTGSARVLIAHVVNQVLHVANIGDAGFAIIRNGKVFKKSSPMVHEFSFPYAIGLGDDSVEDAEEYHIELEDGDVIVTATDGLFDNLYDQEIASIVWKAVETGTHLQGLAELLATKAQEVGMSESARSPFADAAQAAGHSGYSGGKFDHVTVIVSLVQIR